MASHIACLVRYLGELGSRIPAKLHRDGLKTCNNLLFRSLNLENQAGNIILFGSLH